MTKTTQELEGSDEDFQCGFAGSFIPRTSVDVLTKSGLANATNGNPSMETMTATFVRAEAADSDRNREGFLAMARCFSS